MRSLESIINEIAGAAGVTVDAIRSQKRNRNLVLARAEIVSIARKEHHAYIDIARALWRKSHASTLMLEKRYGKKGAGDGQKQLSEKLG